MPWYAQRNAWDENVMVRHPVNLGIEDTEVFETLEDGCTILYVVHGVPSDNSEAIYALYKRLEPLRVLISAEN